MGLSGNFLTQRLILKQLDHTQFKPIVMAPVEGFALDEFRKMGVECAVIEPPGNLDSYGGVVLQEGILGKIKSTFDLVRYNLQLARLFRDWNIHIVYANCVRAQMSTGLATLITGIPSLLYIKSALANPIIDYISLLSADYILFMCRSNLLLRYKKLIKMLRSKITILEGGLELNELNLVFNKDKSVLKHELDIRPVNFNVCVVGQICPLKGQHVVVKALSRLVSEFNSLRVYFVGDPIISEYKPYLENVKKLVEEYNLLDFVRFVGWRNDSLEVMSCMDLLINPSFSEGFGYVPLEAMALGLPVIATKVGILPEAIVDGVNGFLVEPGDYEAITKYWRELFLNQDLRQRLGDEARKTVFSKYMVDDKVKLFSEICMQLVEGKY